MTNYKRDTNKISSNIEKESFVTAVFGTAIKANLVICFIVTTCFITSLGKPITSEISDLCEISVQLLFVSYFASQNKGIKFGDYLLMHVV